MKKLLAFTSILFIALSINAKINTTIWGLTFGRSTKQQIINILNNKGLKYESKRHEIATDMDIITVTTTNYISFGGANWSGMEIYTINNVLYDIQFSKYNEGTYSAHKTFNSLKYKLDQKYSTYKTSDLGSMVSYEDNVMKVFLAICDSNDVGTFYYMNYMYKPILNQHSTKGIDEL